MFELSLTIAFSILNIAVPYAIVRYDRTRLDAAELARGWNGPSFACAIYFFGPLSLPAHFWITRRRLLAALLGAFLAVLVLAVEWGLATAIESMLGAT
jgi:hypothetical protein